MFDNNFFQVKRKLHNDKYLALSLLFSPIHSCYKWLNLKPSFIFSKEHRKKYLFVSSIHTSTNIIHEFFCGDVQNNSSPLRAFSHSLLFLLVEFCVWSNTFYPCLIGLADRRKDRKMERQNWASGRAPIGFILIAQCPIK